MEHKERIQSANHAIDQHRDVTRDFDMNEEQAVTSLLTSLRHYCEAHDIDFTGVVRASKIQHE